MRKDEVQFHSDGYRDGHPAINVKVYSYPTPELARQVAEEHGEDPERFAAYVEREVERGYPSAYTAAEEFAVEDAYEMAQTEADEIFEEHTVKLYSEGRSGGWLVVHGLPEIEDWDAVLLAKWGKFNRYVRDYVDCYVESVLSLLCLNSYQGFLERDDARLNIEYVQTDRRVLVGVSDA